MNFRKWMSVLVVAGLLGTPVAAWADSEADMRAEIEALKSRLAQLESKLTDQIPQTAGGHSWHESNPAVTSLVQGVNVTGYVDTTYSYNFNSPNTRTNVARVFDRHTNSFNLSQAEIDFIKAPTEENRVGFRTDLFFGNDAEVIGSTGLGSAADEFDLEQAYVEMLIPAGNAIPGLNDINLKAGKFVTLAGFEVIESKDNWNTSRGLLFGYAIPFTHTGVRGTYVFDNGWDFALGVNNGWDQTDDANNDKTLEAHFGFNALKLPGESTLTVAINYYGGEENVTIAGLTDSEYRGLLDVVFIWNTPIKPLTLAYNYDYADQEDAITSAAGPVTDNQNWSGHGVHAKWAFNEKWSLAGRYEYFNDDDGARVVAGTPADYWEVTGTLEYRPWNNVITRLEYRHDDADRNVFNDAGTPNLDDQQDTISAEVAYIF